MLRYLDLPLRYPITPMCSRSAIRDEVAGALSDKDRVLPLYAKTKEKGSFEAGIGLFKKDLQQLIDASMTVKYDVSLMYVLTPTVPTLGRAAAQLPIACRTHTICTTVPGSRISGCCSSTMSRSTTNMCARSRRILPRVKRNSPWAVYAMLLFAASVQSARPGSPVVLFS